MFFDSLGRILQRSADVLRNEIRPEIEDIFLVQQIDAIALIVGEVGAAWPQLFEALERENTILESALVEARSAAEASEAGSSPVARDPRIDALGWNRTLLTEIDQVIVRLHESGADDALTRLRHGLHAAACTEGHLLAEARERSGSAQTRRL